jgi:signal transduction histidine kinase
VIALGRVMLAILFLLAVWADHSEPNRSFIGTYGVLICYATGAIGIAVATWRNWWLDARLAAPMHALDMAVFTAIIFSVNGATRPFFLFFVLPLLSAAVRWGWRETALTAAVLIALFLGAGFLLAGNEGWQPERIVVRSGHLIILSLLLIWFGIHQNFSRLFFQAEDIDADLEQDPNPLARALGLAMAATRASGGALFIAPTGDEANDGLMISGGERSSLTLADPIIGRTDAAAMIFDARHDRLLTRRRGGSFNFASASSVLSMEQLARLGFCEGLATRVVTSTQEGWLFLWKIPDLSCDYLELGSELGRAAGTVIDRHELLQAIEISAAARTRLGLARDVHDSIVQFLAGAAFRVEAIKRSAASGNVSQELDELKRLLVEEQGEIRGFLLALRRERELDLAEAVAELKLLAERLGQQWAVDCHVTATEGASSIPIRLQLDLQQMLREAVANAVRHGGANRVDVDLAVDKGHVQLSVVDNGTGFAVAAGKKPKEPWSLKERVERAHGSLNLVTAPGSTNIVISLPLAGAAA